MRRKGCEVYQQWISEALNGRLPQAQRRALEEHLQACGACRAFRRDMERLLRLFRSMASVEPPADLPQRILMRVRQEAPSWGRPFLPSPLWRSRWLAAGAVAVALLIGFWLGRNTWPPLPAAPPVLIVTRYAPETEVRLEPGQGLLEEFLQDYSSVERVNPLGEAHLSWMSLSLPADGNEP